MSIRVRIKDSNEPISHVSLFDHLGRELHFDVGTATLYGLSNPSLLNLADAAGLEEGVLEAVLNGSFGEREGRAARRAM